MNVLMDMVVKIAPKELDSVSQTIHVKTKVPAYTTLTLPTTFVSVVKASKDATVPTISMSVNKSQDCAGLLIGNHLAGTPKGLMYVIVQTNSMVGNALKMWTNALHLQIASMVNFVKMWSLHGIIQMGIFVNASPDGEVRLT